MAWAVFWLGAENSVDNSGMVLLFLSRTYTELKPFLLLTPPVMRLGGVQGIVRGHSWNR